MRRNDICYYDYRDGGPNHYGRIWKILDGVYYFLQTSGKLIKVDDTTRLIRVKGYKGYWQWKTDFKTSEQYPVYVRMPSLRKIKQTPWFRNCFKDE